MTPALGLLLTTCALMAAPAKEEDPAARAQATLQRVSKLPSDHQRVWLRLIEQRYGWAVLLTLKPEDAKAEQARVAKILRQKTVAWNDLLTLLRQLDQREKAAIARLVRQYRSQVYETFRKQPHDTVDRQEAWYRIWLSWERSGSPPEQQDRLMDWLADAIKACSKDSIGPLPPDPSFGPSVELVPEQLVRQWTQPPAVKPGETRPAETKPAAPRQPAEGPQPSPELQARAPLPLGVPDPRRGAAPRKLPTEAILARRAENIMSLPWPAEAPPAVAPPLHVLPIAVDDPRELTTPPAPPRHASVVAVQREALPAAEDRTGMVAKAGPADTTPQAIGPRRQPSGMPPPRTVEPPPPEGPATALATVAARLPAASPAESAEAEADPILQSESAGNRPENSRGPALQLEMLAQLPQKLAESAIPRPERPAEYRVDRKPLGPDVAADQPPTASPAAALADQHAQVNVEELGTRIEGINLSLRNLEGEINEKREFTTDQLGSLLSRLDILVLRQRDLTLFRDLIAPKEQAKVGQIDSPRSIVAAMGTRIAEQRSRIRENEGLSEAMRTAALKQLDELSDRLATMTTEK